MKTCDCQWHPDRETWLDALALVWLLGVGDRDGFATILANYLDGRDSLVSLIHAIAHTALDTMMALSVATGRTPDVILGGARDWVISHG